MNPEPVVVPDAPQEPGITPAPPEKTYTQAQWDELHGRATRAEAAAKAASPATPLNVEETVLLANGMPEELLKELKAVAQVRGTSLLKAQTDPIFVAVKSTYEEAKKKEAAALPASRGAAPVKVKKDFATPGLARDEHKEMFYASQS